MLQSGLRCALFLGATLGLISQACVIRGEDVAEKAQEIGTRIADQYVLRDVLGNRRSLQEFAGLNAIVLAFLGTESPTSDLNLPALIRMEKQYRDQRIGFIGVFPNDHEDLEQIAMHRHDHDVPFLVLKDCDRQLADALGVTRVPTFVVLDGDFVFRYRGRMNDQYGDVSRKSQATREDLQLAIDEVLTGKPVAVSVTDVEGSPVQRAAQRSGLTEISYTKDVSRIFQDRCQTCHRPGQIGKFELMSYEDAAQRGEMIKEVVTQRRMPPWQADPRYGKFIHDRRLENSEIETLAAWVDAGMPRGDDKDSPSPVEWPSGLSRGTPDQVFTMPEEFTVPADGSTVFQRFVLAKEFTEDRWVRAAYATPGSPSLVQSLTVFAESDKTQSLPSLDSNNSLLAAWAHGALGEFVWPPDTAMRLPKGAQLIMGIQYNPTGKITKDRSSVAFTYAKETPRYELVYNYFLNDSIRVPANEPHYRAETTFRLAADARIIGFTPYMRLRGKDYSYEAIYPDGRRETLLSIPRFDFSWPTFYQFKEPVRLPKGSMIHAVAHWDNSHYNLRNPAPDKTALYGQQTTDETMIGGVFFAWEHPDASAELVRNPVSIPDVLFNRLDCNGDDLVTSLTEIPYRWKVTLDERGIKVAEVMNRQDFTKWFTVTSQQVPLAGVSGFDGRLLPMIAKKEPLKPEPVRERQVSDEREQRPTDHIPARALANRQRDVAFLALAYQRILDHVYIIVSIVIIVLGALIYKRPWRKDQPDSPSIGPDVWR